MERPRFTQFRQHRLHQKKTRRPVQEYDTIPVYGRPGQCETYIIEIC